MANPASQPYAPPVITMATGPPPAPPSPPTAEQQQAIIKARTEEWRHRRWFVGRVLSVVFLQLLFMTGMGLMFYFVKPLKEYVHTHPWVFAITFGIAAFTVLAISFNQTLRSKHPWNLLALLLFTLAFGFLVGTITSYASVQVVFLAVAITASVVAMLFVVAVFSPFDFTHWGSVLGIATWALVMTLLFSFWGVRKQDFPVWHAVIAGAAAVLFSVWLVYDLQALLGAGPLLRFRRQALEPNNWVSGALAIYLDIGLIFTSFLGLAGCHF